MLGFVGLSEEQQPLSGRRPAGSSDSSRYIADAYLAGETVMSPVLQDFSLMEVIERGGLGRDTRKQGEGLAAGRGSRCLEVV